MGSKAREGAKAILTVLAKRERWCCCAFPLENLMDELLMLCVIFVKKEEEKMLLFPISV